ncbi:hypothetical protein PHISCL_05262 [Aspergillus sclerotialis]|uniref:C2H2-type domain-containing protein n=1 Tax=Aspergillus sclerotialis TaxID=2070753 RepID=A0A3A2ZZB4_9EURO|nr:hypothetical protein PHISCL_05262 [Aspergillus sclerotialis]
MEECLPVSSEHTNLFDAYFGDPNLSIHQSTNGLDGLQSLGMDPQLTASFTSPSFSMDSALGSEVSPPAQLMYMEGSREQSIQPWLLDEIEGRELGNDSSVPLQQPFTNQFTPERGIDTGVSSSVSNRIAAPHTGLPRRRSLYLMQHSGRDKGPIVIPNPTALNPMERWRESPPEDEPASMTAILNALKETPPEQPVQHGTDSTQDAEHFTNAFLQYRRAASTTSGGSSGSSRISQQSGRSHSSTHDPIAVPNRQRRGRVAKATRRDRNTAIKQRRYCCTFCCDRFKNKYDWARHEKSLHVNLETWYCAPFGTTVVSPLTQRKHCAFCNEVDPDSRHLDRHAYRACESDSGARRSFRRKDHLVQHLQLIHNVEAPPALDDWKIGHSVITSRCGFCDQRLNTWDQRVEHLAEHFRKGATMDEWRGEHDFPVEFAAQIVKSLPPYLIGSESKSLIPFSATNSDVRDHHEQISSRARDSVNLTDRPQSPSRSAQEPSAASLQSLVPAVSTAQLSSFTQVLTLHLSRYAREQMKEGIIPTDEMFQQESRRLLYDSEDSWNQTIADNPEWLSAFRGLYCDENVDHNEADQQLTGPP